MPAYPLVGYLAWAILFGALRRRQDAPLAAYRELCRELAKAGPGTFGELDSTGARSVLRRYSDAWFAAAKRRRAGDAAARFPRRQRAAGTRHQRRVRQAQHEAAKTVIGWAVQHRVGTLAVGDPRGVLGLAAGRQHNQRVRAWRIGHLIRALADKAQAAGITVTLVDERGTSSTCPGCARRVPKPAGRTFSCPHCGHDGHRDLVAAANIAARAGGGTIPAESTGGITHRRAGAHLPGVHPARRDPRRRPHRGPPQGPLAGTGPPRTPHRLAGSRSSHREEPGIHPSIYRQVH
jgi:IS605 OrfB family transposase